MTKEEITICKMYLEDLDKHHDCNEYKLLMGLLEQEPILDKIRAEINRQEKWLLQAGYTAYNVDIAFDTIKAVLAESEE